MKIGKTICAAVLTALIMATGARETLGQLSAKTSMVVYFHVPEEVDPNQVFNFTSPTQSFTSNGADLMNVGYPYLLGVELHSKILGSSPGFLKDINSVTVCLNYSGSVTASIFDGFTSGFYTPWTITGGLETPDRYCFTFTEPTGGAPINDNFTPGHGNSMLTSFGTLTIVPVANGPVIDFLNENADSTSITYKATVNGVERQSVPEPGVAGVMGSTILFAALWVWRRKSVD